jgi:predicted ATP-grasp superfamily ATP-dependent carboligase
LRRSYRYNGFLGSIRSALRAAKPDFVIPCDDYGTLGLHRLHKESRNDGSGLARLIEHSLGNPEHFNVVETRGNLLAVARELDIAVPDTEILSGKEALDTWVSTHRLPAYFKADGTAGGVGVRLVESSERAERAFQALSAPPGAVRTIKRALVDRDMRLVVPCLRRWRPVVNVQKVISGSEANCAVSCWKGRLLACISAEVVKRDDDYGPATVIRVIDNPEMLAAAKKIAAKFELSGLFGLDFILETGTRTAYLLEMNARSTQTCHFELSPGRSLVHPLVRELSGESAETATEPSTTSGGTIALFPAEWKRDPRSPYLTSGRHDVPWEEPRLVRYCIKTHLKDRSWMSFRKWRARKAKVAKDADRSH